MAIISVNSEPTAIPAASIEESTDYTFQNVGDSPIRALVATTAPDAGSEDGTLIRSRRGIKMNRGTDNLYLWTDDGESSMYFIQSNRISEL